MGCNCGGGAGRARMMGTVPAMPMIFGKDDPSLPVRRVQIINASAGTPAGATRYVRGADVDSMIVSGSLRLLETAEV